METTALLPNSQGSVTCPCPEPHRPPHPSYPIKPLEEGLPVCKEKNIRPAKQSYPFCARSYRTVIEIFSV
jgi:hypothetical protein